MSRITPITGIAFGVLLALIALFAITAPRTEATSGALRAEMACSPLTSSQSVQPGDSQFCRIRIRNTDQNRYDSQGNMTYAAQPVTGITYDRPTPNTLTARYPLKASYGLSCDLSGCDPFDLAPGKSVIIIETSTFNPSQDGRGKTTVTATGTHNGGSVTASGTEQNTLP